MAQANSGFFGQLFQRGSQQNQQQQHNRQQNQNQQQQNNNQQQQNQQQNGTNNPEQIQSPLDAYKGLFDNIPDNQEQAPQFDIDLKQINGVADSLDFTRSMPDDMRESIMETFGDKAQAVEALLNHIGRQAYATAIKHGSSLTGKYIDVRSGFDRKGLDKVVKDHMTLSGVDTLEVARKNPVVRENLRMIAQNLARKYPDATPQEIQDMSQKFFKDMATALTPENIQQQQELDRKKAPGGEDFDWEGWQKGTNTSQ